MSETDDETIFGESTDGDDSVQPTSHSTSNWKVLGEIGASDGTGVLGHSTSGSGATTGVEGVVDSSDPDAVGVRGSAKGDNLGVLAQVFDDHSSLLDLGSTESVGVFGRTDKAEGLGVVGYSLNNFAVAGRTDDGDSAALFGINAAGGDALQTDGHATLSGNLEVIGHSDIGNVGLSAYLSSDFEVPDGTVKTIEFDSAPVDHFNGYDDTSGKYTVQQAGDYNVDFLIDWRDSFNEGNPITYYLLINGGISGGLAADTNVATNTDPSRHFGRTLFGLSQDDTIEVAIRQDSGSGKFITGVSSEQTYLTIHKVG